MKSQRADIQGLRAIAVLLVITNHVLGWPDGGFTGVDIFFVISGFLITGHLIREHESTGRISLPRFYARRARRILPAAVTVTLVTVVLPFIVFTKARALSVFVDGVWATLFAANWRLISVNTDYMHMGDAVSPLQHYWSLSIEEQFYLIWPVVMVGAISLATTRRRPTRVAAGVAMTAIVVASLTWAMVETALHPTWSYFSTFARGWELGAGGVLAISAAGLACLPALARPFIAWAGLSMLAVGALVITAETPFPGPWALVPVAGTLLVIAAGTGGPVSFLAPITNRVFGYIGDISYSLYLWHWPVFVLAGVFLAQHPRRLAAVVLLATALVSSVSYHFIENPIRHREAKYRVIKSTATIAAITLVAVAIVTVASRPHEAVNAATRQYAATPAGKLARSVDTALAMTTWPDLTPRIDTIGPKNKAPEWVEDGCLGNEAGARADPIENANRCMYGDGPKAAVLIGDSVAISWLPGIRAALPDYTIHVFTMQRCASPAMAVVFRDFDSAACDRFRNWTQEEIKRLHPDLVITSNVSWQLLKPTPAAQKAWETASHDLYALLPQVADRVVVLQGPPAAKGFDTCAGAGTTPADCLLRLSPSYVAMAAADRAAVEGTGTIFESTEGWFCAPDGKCPSFADGIAVMADSSHLTRDYSAHLAPVLRDALTAAR